MTAPEVLIEATEALVAKARRHPWLRDDCRVDDLAGKVHGDQTVYRGHRRSPDGTMIVDTPANMAGPEADIEVAEGFSIAPDDGWSLRQALDSTEATTADDRVRLPDGAAVTRIWECV